MFWTKTKRERDTLREQIESRKKELDIIRQQNVSLCNKLGAMTHRAETAEKRAVNYMNLLAESCKSGEELTEQIHKQKAINDDLRTDLAEWRNRAIEMEDVDAFEADNESPVVAPSLPILVHF